MLYENSLGEALSSRHICVHICGEMILISSITASYPEMKTKFGIVDVDIFCFVKAAGVPVTFFILPCDCTS